MKLTNDLKTWVADNILAGCTPEQLKQPLISLEVPVADIDAVLCEVVNHPYVESARKIQAQLAKRNALIQTLDSLNKEDASYLKPKKVCLPVFKIFLEDYYYRNKVGHFKGGIDHWEARNWTPRNLVEKVGADTLVQVQIGRSKEKDYEPNSSKFRENIKFGKFIDMVESKESNDFYLTANNQAFSNFGLKNLARDVGNIGDGYFNLADADQRMFLWIGPKGIITPMHHDLTNNWFVQVYGKKIFRLIPSLQVPYLYNNNHVYSDIDLLNINYSKHPQFKRADVIEIQVDAGDCLFIPIGWWHHVVGETASISLSFTNLNVSVNTMMDYPQGSRY